MKQLTVIVILALYSASTLGIGVKQFYCCGKLKSVKFTFADDAKEKSEKGNNEGGCCKTEHQYLKVKDSHLAPGDFVTPEKFLVDINFLPFFNESITINAAHRVTSHSIHASPLVSRPIYIFNCVYRI